MLLSRRRLLVPKALKSEFKKPKISCEILSNTPPYPLEQWFPNFSATQTTKNILVVREAQNIDLDRDLPTTFANLADH